MQGDVEANDSLHRQFTLSCKVSKCHLTFDAFSAFSVVQGCNTFSFVLRTIAVYSYLERCVSLERAPVGGRLFRPSAAVESGCRFRPSFGRMKFVFIVFL